MAPFVAAECLGAVTEAPQGGDAMFRGLRVLSLAAMLSLATIAFGALTPRPVFATCASDHITLYDPINGGSPSQSFCLTGGVGNLPNLHEIPGPCAQWFHANSWNDCVSSVRVQAGQTQCFATYSAANYSGLMATYWGPYTEQLFNVSPNDVMSSVRQYAKVPATPAGNC